MSVGHLGKATNNEDDIIQLDALTEVQTKWGEMPGVVLSFDATRQTVTIRPSYRPTIRGRAVPLPDLYDVPVRFPRTQTRAMTFPIQAGDILTLRPMMRSTVNYHDGRAPSIIVMMIAIMRCRIWKHISMARLVS